MSSTARNTSADSYTFWLPGIGEHIWAALVKQTGDDNPSMIDTESGERWQYMGSIWTESHDARHWPVLGHVVHQFRHRCHPKTNSRLYVDIKNVNKYGHMCVSPKPENAKIQN